jgi:hypothetical protein
MNQTFLEYFRCPERYVRLRVKDGLSENSGFFRFGQGVVGYGKYAHHRPADSPRGQLLDAWADVDCASGSVCLPFDLDEVVENLRLERYTEDRQYGSSGNGLIARVYYAFRPFLSVAFRRHLQRAYLGDWSKIAFPNWPVDHTVDSIVRGSMQLLLRTQQLDRIPFIWFWPDGASSGAIMTHDVETAAGRDFCASLMTLNESFGITASFQIVPEDRYEVSEKFLDSIRKRGFEVNVQDLNHDGRLYKDRSEFARRADQINDYGRQNCPRSQNDTDETTYRSDMRVSVFGVGYVGCVTAACLAREGHCVIGVDVDPFKVQSINEGRSPFFEPGLDELVCDMVTSGRLRATVDHADAVRNSDIALICVGTPTNSNGSIRLEYLRHVFTSIAKELRESADYYVVALRSTVLPPAFEDELIPLLEKHSGKSVGEHIGFVYNPEFLREGVALKDFPGRL